MGSNPIARAKRNKPWREWQRLKKFLRRYFGELDKSCYADDGSVIRNPREIKRLSNHPANHACNCCGSRRQGWGTLSMRLTKQEWSEIELERYCPWWLDVETEANSEL